MAEFTCVYSKVTRLLKLRSITLLTEKSVFFLSWLTARGSGIGSVCFITLTLSPKKIYMYIKSLRLKHKWITTILI